jgi:hypothetical protein
VLSLSTCPVSGSGASWCSEGLLIFRTTDFLLQLPQSRALREASSTPSGKPNQPTLPPEVTKL